jgi:hypothetical protein
MELLEKKLATTVTALDLLLWKGKKRSALLLALVGLGRLVLLSEGALETTVSLAKS